jgi:predicted TIM-barrel fold metal-dependent hydrolase
MDHRNLERYYDVNLLRQNYAAPFTSGSSRREFLRTLAAAGAGALLPGSGLLAQANRPALGRIDVHHHMIPPFYVKAMEAIRGPRTSTATEPWKPSVSLDEMDKNGVTTAMLSLTQGVAGDSLNDRSERARSLARQNNEFGAQVVKDNPARFGLLASLPLPDQDGSLKEIAYSFDTLKADGIALWNVYGDKWPGDPAYAAVFDELNRRKAVVFFHPMSSSTCCGTMDFQFDVETASTISSLLMGGTLARCRDVKYIFSHAGGAFTVLWPRLTDAFPAKFADRAPNGVEYELRRLYFDTAKANHPSILDALKDTVPTSQIVYGSDVPVQKYSLTNPGLEAYPGFSADDWKAINRGNAERLFPRLKS